MRFHNGIPADEQAVIEWADRLGSYVKPLAVGRYRLTEYSTLKLIERNSLEDVISYLCGKQNDDNWALSQLGL
jgi:hypothetical protein